MQGAILYFEKLKKGDAVIHFGEIKDPAEGMIGYGFMGRAHSNALLQVSRFFDLRHKPVLKACCGRDPVKLKAFAEAWGYEAMETELILSDMAVIEKRLERLQKERTRSEQPLELPLMQRLIAHLEAQKPLRSIDLTAEEERLLRSYSLLSLKPMVIVLNVNDDADANEAEQQLGALLGREILLQLRGKLEMELAQMDTADAAMFLEEFGLSEPGLDRVIRAGYDLLGVQSFFTVGEDEVRAWTVRRGAPAVEAAGVIHSDLAKGFIRAEVVSYQDLITTGSIPEARRVGKFRLEGRDYIVKDGDILHVRFNL